MKTNDKDETLRQQIDRLCYLHGFSIKLIAQFSGLSYKTTRDFLKGKHISQRSFDKLNRTVRIYSKYRSKRLTLYMEDYGNI